MIKINNKMPTTVVLLIFSYFIAVSGFCTAVILMIFKFMGMNSLIYGFLILTGSLLLAALIRMSAIIGQMIFDMGIDIQRLSGQSRELEQKLNQDLKNKLQLQTDTLSKDLRAQTDTLTQSLQAIIQKLDKFSQEAKELGQKLASIKENFDQMNCDSKDISQNMQHVKTFFEEQELGQKLASIKENFDQMNCDSKDMNQNIQQIRAFFEQIEKHLDLKK